MIKTLKHFYSCPTCKFKEQDGNCDEKRRWNMKKDQNYFCNAWDSRKNIKPIYHKIARILVKIGYFNL